MLVLHSTLWVQILKRKTFVFLILRVKCRNTGGNDLVLHECILDISSDKAHSFKQNHCY